ncbi:solute carrier family 15 member 2-like isoform X2 [Macrobrachium nipponense]|uniref:solute carrier family 15 member 2-like isoform X2 n=1 Tax=Macrobrachium nipponense TaxID=159736 RepID=UPI0030C8493C
MAVTPKPRVPQVMYSLLSDDDDDDGFLHVGVCGEDDDEEEEEEELFCRESSKLLDGGEKTYRDPESTEEKIPYPKSVFFIIGNELCERFSYYGMKTILTLYLKYQLLFSEDSSTVIYHVWAMMCYFTPLLGAIIADTVLGRFRTIFYISIIYVLGNAVLSLSAITPFFPSLDPKIGVAMTGLFLIALGTGGIKPCVSAFGGDQFVLPQQEKELTRFFSIFYFSINTGSFLSTYTTPLLRDDVKCFGQDCYALAFGVPAVLMVIALVWFLIGNKYYIKKPAGSNVLVEVTSTISHALKMKRKSPKMRDHWLDHADDKFSKELIADVKVLLKVLLMYIPLPIFWALFDQQGSRWTFQATRMNGEIGGFTIKPDQMQVVNPVLILILIPIFDSFIYPMLGKCNLLKRQLPRMFVGGLLAGIAFVVSGMLELKLESTYPVPVGQGEARLSFINTLPCDVTFSPEWDESVTLTSMEQKKYESVPLDRPGSILNDLHVSISFDKTACGEVTEYNEGPITVQVVDKTAFTAMITASDHKAMIVNVNPPDEYEKPTAGNPSVRMLFNLDPSIPFNSSVLLKLPEDSLSYNFYISNSDQGHISGTKFQTIEPGTYDVFLPTTKLGEHEKEPIGEITVKFGGVYNFLVEKPLVKGENATVTVYQITEENSVHMLWLIPQYLIITISEVMFSITGLEFSFTQAPATMKSVLQAAWLLTTAFGNLIVVVVAEAKFVKRQSMEFFLFAGLMFVDMVIFAALAFNYKYVDEVKEERTNTNTRADDDRPPVAAAGKENEGFCDDETKL